MTKSQMVAKALGIEGEQYSRWADMQVERAESEETVARFNLEGPIVGTAMQMYVDEIEGASTPGMLREFLQENEGKDIEININSPGGSVFDAAAMVSDLMRHDGAVRVVVSGACFSAAADFLTIPHAHRVIMPGGMVMIHNAWTIAGGDSRAFSKVADRLEKMNDMCASRFEDCTVYTAEELRAMMDDETWFTDEQAYQGGLVDEIYGMDDDEEYESMEEDAADDDGVMAADGDLAIERGNRAVASRLATKII